MLPKLKPIVLAILFLCGYTVQLEAQNYNLFKDYLETFETQPASARAAAMGYAQVANGGTIAEARINPATLSRMPQKLQTELSTAWPSFIDKKSRSAFIGAAYRINDKLTVGLSRFGYNVKKPKFGFNSGNNPTYYANKVNEAFYTGTASYQVKKGLYAGVNLSYFTYAIKPGGTAGSFTGDLGVLYEKPLAK